MLIARQRGDGEFREMIVRCRDDHDVDVVARQQFVAAGTHFGRELPSERFCRLEIDVVHGTQHASVRKGRRTFLADSPATDETDTMLALCRHLSARQTDRRRYDEVGTCSEKVRRARLRRAGSRYSNDRSG